MKKDAQQSVTVDVTDFKSMLDAMGADASLHWCSTCGAWIEADNPALAITEDYVGCWKIATGGNNDYDHLCASHRGALIDEVRLVLHTHTHVTEVSFSPKP